MWKNIRLAIGILYGMPVSWSMPRPHAYICESSSLLFFFLCLFSFASFFFCIFFRLSGVSWHQIIVESCASPSNNLISLRYPMPVFSANSFGLFFPDLTAFWQSLWKIFFYQLILNILARYFIMSWNTRMIFSPTSFEMFWERPATLHRT